MSVLVVAAHPDDEVLGMGGTIARVRPEGSPPVVRVLTMTDGTGARRGGPRSAREQELFASAKVLGAIVWGVGSFPDNAMDSIPLLKIIQRVELAIAAVKPDTIYTHRRDDLNVDHQLTHRAVITATRPGTSPVRDIYAFDSPSSSEWSFGAGGFAPNVFQELTVDEVSQGALALECYDSELRLSPHPRSVHQFWIRRQYYGSIAGFDYAEPFELVRSLRA